MERAQHALIDPLIEPDPSEETGLNSHFRSTFAPQPHTPPESVGLPKEQPPVQIRQQPTGSSVETNPFRRSRASSDAQSPAASKYGQATPPRSTHGYPSPPNSASPRRENFSDHRADIFGPLNEGRPRRSSNPSPHHQSTNRATRSGSLRERYPGDRSHMPLDTIRKDDKTAHRSHHLRKKNQQGADVIDRLDKTGFGGYHHEGPYDAANIARNRHKKYSPIAAVQDSNEEALRATPRENIIDAITKHRPLEGVANIPPGVPDRFGRVLHYEEGADLQREPGGDYRRWPGVEYKPEDLKGKGEPSFTIERALKEHKTLGDSGTEMLSPCPTNARQHSRSVGHVDAPTSYPAEHVGMEKNELGRSNTTGKSMGSALRRGLGSLRRRKGGEVEA